MRWLRMVIRAIPLISISGFGERLRMREGGSAALKLFGFGALGLSEQDFLVPHAVIQLGYPPARIDLITAIDGVEFDQCHG